MSKSKMDRIHWNAGDRLIISAYHSKPGKGLSYEAQEIIATEDGCSGGWDVWDGENDFSFYGFSVEKVVSPKSL